MNPVERLLAKLTNVEPTAAGWSARCPAHDDSRNSLSIAEGDDGRALLHCHAKCPPLNICRSLGMTLPDLMPSRNGSNGPRKIVAEYDYRDENDAVLYQVVRMDPKDFRQRKPDGNGGWNWSTKDVRRVLYRLPELRAADPSLPVYVVEGEKDADRLAEIGFITTCNAGGAGKWRDDYVEHLRGRNVVVLPDNDDPGKKHAEEVARSLIGVASDVQIISVPGAKDIGDWLGPYRERDDVDRLVQRRRGIDRLRWHHVFGGGNERGTPSTSSSPSRSKIYVPIAAEDMVRQYPHLRTPVIEGVCREGETMNIIAPPKVGKSWLVLSLAFSVANGVPWLGRFPVRQGKVLIIDNELHRETISDRLKRVAEAMNLSRKGIDIIPLRGEETSYHTISPTIESLGQQYSLILMDAHYRMLGGANENSNSEITGVFNLIDRYAEMTKAAWMPVHHASKGDQSEKDVTDVGAGAGAQGRAADMHMALRRHEKDGCFVLEVAPRSWPPLDPMVVRWEFPTWVLAEGMNPKMLATPQTRKNQRNDEEGKERILAELRSEPGTPNQLAERTGMDRRRVVRLLEPMANDREVVAEEIILRNNPATMYRIRSDA